MAKFVFRCEFGNFCTSITKLRTRPTRFNDSNSYIKVALLPVQPLRKTLHAKFCGMIHRIGRISDLPAIRRNLNYSPAALLTHIRQCRFYQHDRAGKVRSNNVVNLLVGQFFCSTKKPVTSITDNSTSTNDLNRSCR